MTALVVAGLGCTIWIYLAVARGGFWRARETDEAMQVRSGHRPRVVAVIPARNEAELVGITVGSLLAQDYAGALDVVVVDDHSDDGTADVARAAAVAVNAGARLTVITAAPLPADWTGKVWAMAQGVAHCDASADPPEYLLLTDADIRYDSGALSALVSSTVENRLVLSSLMVKLRCKSLAERLLIPAFVFFFQMLYPFAWVNRPDRRMAAAAGGCMLVHRTTLRDAGGIAAIRTALIDDCALARVMKRRGAIHLALGQRVQSLRAYPSFHDIRRMIVRSAYAQLQFSWWRLAFVIVAMAVVFLAPAVLAWSSTGIARLLAVATWALMAMLFAPMLRHYGMPTWWGVGLPAIAAAYLAFTVESAIQHVRGRSGLWKGRVQGHASGLP